ncbi:hypothetical protein K7X08_021852 [Anisodus acutangulus]|uniref:Leucine-rich repeat-containing N-terminal plant-type domain-containing protein n=1 Tax=Anisodus acutangulus TaxID=402998 RepID=A0A9Q1L675_9SOLA|nr:hypothetical protein K7X08_021852 [Anisodus acutangulus]
MAILFLFYSLFCFSFLSQSFSSSSVHHLCSPDEASALLHFKQSFSYPDDDGYSCANTSPFPKRTSWNESRDCCSWDGVTCDLLTGHVISLDLSCSQLGGSIHPNSSLFQLHHLQTLHLSLNHFTGHIPDFIGNLTQLRELDFSGNYFTGHIPDFIGSLTQLRELDFGYNHFTGHIPNSIGNLTQLRELDLSYNSLGGNIPDVFSNLQELVVLDLSRNSFSGPFPSSILSLGHLDTLDLSSNNITSINESTTTFPSLTTVILSSCELKDFPHFLRNVKTLELLDLSNNKIHGPIPNWFSGMRWDSLWYLNLSHNSLTGHLQHFHYYNLRYLDLKFNFLQGQLPSSICNMSKLEFLDLSRNYFSESVPYCLGSMTKLLILDLRMNNFSGSLPPFCTQSTSLTTIVLNGNRFEGPVHVSLHNCVGLEVLDMGNNAINDTFPAWLGDLLELQVLILKSNKFHGPISTRKKFCFPRLRIFDLSHNEFSGSLPAEVFLNFKAMMKNGTDKGDFRYMTVSNLSFVTYKDSVRLVIKGNEVQLERISTIMTTIDLSSNHFEGVIPKTLKDLGSLWQLNLSHNNLIRDIPMELGQLNTLETLDLSWNRLTGKIPQELTRLTFLEKLNLSQNLLDGPIPQGPQFNTFSNDSYGGNLGLCGPPLSKECRTSDPSHVPQPLESDEEDDSYFASGFTWESVVIGYSCGLVVGTVMWSLMFKARKPKWLVEFLEGAFPKKMRRAQKRRLRRQT